MIKRALYAIAYNLLLCPGLLFACYKLYWPRQGKRAFGRRWIEHFGFGKRTEPVDLWFHAVSVGEVIASTALIKATLKARPDWQILVTTTTATGAEEVRKRLGDRVQHRFAPFDLLPCIALFLHRYQPRRLWIMETELWPNWLWLAKRRNIPTALINARMSERSARRYQRFATVAELLFGRLDWIGAQYPDDAKRFIQIGAKAHQVATTGSIKFDITLDESRIGAARAQRHSLFGDRPVLAAISTHRGEDQPILEMAHQLRQNHPKLLLVLVPRHPERFDEVALLASRFGPIVRRSEKSDVSAKTLTYVGDTMGELLDLLAMSDIALMGGSLEPIGGHNYLEPAALGVPCVSGPYDFNFSEISQQLQHAGALVVDTQTDQLAEQIAQWLSQREAYTQASNAAHQVVTRNRGALQKTLDQLLHY
ncbi:lipid IV(A) 3-deoxy-D-manno-octulosonic acid transferase [Celerinatantimonas sp. YJH-8]|uniref:lipid IV(A) 3-deoxy-D-manno-octulosonic acid transferase n=1 Tax=Celerinatantimonas sp. YJH-8 TaxID=3228714 RepID=UPI0038C53CE1